MDAFKKSTIKNYDYWGVRTTNVPPMRKERTVLRSFKHGGRQTLRKAMRAEAEER